jgi:hypothetical protein
MGGELIGLVAVILGMGVPLGALYTYYRVRNLRSEERLAAIARGVEIPVEPELTQAARSRRSGNWPMNGLALLGCSHAAVNHGVRFWSTTSTPASA